MWSQYDENLEENPFFKLIQDNYKDLLDKVSYERWLICVPRIGSYDSSKISFDVILDHILILGSGDNYCTFSKKSVKLKNKRLFMDSSYSCYNNDVEILFEETFYTKKPAKYTVWCIDRPLFLKQHYCDSHRSVFLENLHDCIDFLWAESVGHDILDNIRQLVEKFIKQHEDIELEDLQTQKELIGELYSQCLQAGFRSKVVREKSRNNTVFMENFKLSVETYMQYSLGNKLIFCVNTLQYQTDAIMNKIIKNSCDLQLEDLGISSKLSGVITLVKAEMGKIGSYVTVLDKVTCLRKTFNLIFENKDVSITSDDILQILIFVILKLNVNNWTANLIYIKEFNYSLSNPSDQNNFFVTSLEAALEYIKSNEFLDLKFNKRDDNDGIYDTINKINDSLKCGQKDVLLNLFSKEKVNLKTKLCHPLCPCENCQNIVNANQGNYYSKICNDKNQNLLVIAAILGYVNVIEYLITKGFDVNQFDCYNKTALHYAAANGYQNVLLVLISHKANVNAVDNYKNTPLHLACLHGQENCVKALIYSSAELEINVENSFGDTPLHVATKWGYYEITKALLENGASLAVKNKRKQTVLNLAPNYHIFKLFQQLGIDNSKTILKQIENKDKEIVIREERIYSDQCKEHGIRPKNVEQHKKIELLLKAIENNDLPLTCFYLGFSCNSYTNFDSSTCHPLCNCEKCKSCHLETSSSTNVKNININMCNVNGVTPLHVAAKFGRTEILRLLLDSGASPNVKTYKTLYTPLHLGCIFQRVQTVRELLKCGDCKVDECDAEGNTSLFYACEKNDIKIVELLLYNGADCNKKNCYGQTPLLQSQENMQYRIFKMMKNSLTNNLINNSLKEGFENLLK